MGRKLNISQPAVIQTELRPLDENFWIDANGSLEQWYYQNTNVFAPDRQITPLVLTPYLSVIDRDTNITYVPNSSNNWVKKVVGQEPEVIPNSSAFQLDHWEVKEYVDGAWATTTITSQSQNENYVLSGLNLIVRKNNYDATHAITITCKATYNDPRDAGAQHGVQESAMLVTSVDATQAFPKIDIVNPATRTYNPLKDESHVFEFEGKADWGGVEAQGGTAITECKVDPLGTEQILPTNDEMVINAAPTLNIHYGDIEKSDQQFMYRQTANGEVSEIVGGVSAIDNIKGNTVAWNQLIENPNFIGNEKWLSSSGSISALDNILTYTISNPYNGNCVYQSNRKHITGHKYFISVMLKYSTAPQVFDQWVGIAGYWGVINKSDIINANEWYHLEGITEDNGLAPDDNFCLYLRTQSMSVGETVQIKNPIMLDLTLIYGAGNEPSTVEEFETWLANNVGLKDYYEYCSGKLVNFGGYGVKWNQLVLDNEINYSGSIEPSAVLELCSIISYVSGHKYLMHLTGNIPNGCVVQTDGMQPIIWATRNEYSIGTANSSFMSRPFLNNIGSSALSYNFNLNLHDLTEMFGAGNEPTLEWCNKYFSKDYYPYCPSVEKNILDVMTAKESGFNIWDEEWEVGAFDSRTGIPIDTYKNCIRSKNYCPVNPNTTYYFRCGTTVGAVYVYDSNKNFIRFFEPHNTTFVTPANAAYFKIGTNAGTGTTYNHDICINVSDPARNGEYEPYHVQYKSPEMGIKTTGFNQWDEEYLMGYYDIYSPNAPYTPNNRQICTKNFIPVIPEYTYHIHAGNNAFDNWCIYYDANMAYLGKTQYTNNSYIVIPADTYYINLNFGSAYGSTYNNDICINISDPSKNGTYEPYWESKSDMSWITKIGIENFNIWDEEWVNGYYDATTGVYVYNPSFPNHFCSKNFIPVSPNTTYYVSRASAFCFYDNSKNFISSTNDVNSVTTPSNAAYMTFTIGNYGTAYNNDICINLSNAHFNGRYYPHGETAPYFPNGLCNAGSVFDEVKVQGGKIKGVVRIGSVDLGTLDYSIESASFGSGAFRAELPNDAHGGNSDVYQRSNIKCSKYKYTSTDGLSGDDKAVAMWGDSTTFLVKDTGYSSYTPEQVEVALSGVTLYYELLTPYEFEIDYPTKGQFMWYGVDGSNNEVPIDQLPIYSQATQPRGYGQGTSRININALYGENIPVILRVKRYPWSPTVLPPKVTKSVAWSVPPIDVITTCDKGSAVRATNSSENFIFGTIVNQQGEIISEEKKAENMVFDWYMVKYGTSGAIKSPKGSGLTKAIPASELKNTTPNGGVTPSTNVYCEAFLLGAYHLVDGQYVRTKD